MFVFTPNAICTIGAHVYTSQYQRAIPVEVVGEYGNCFTWNILTHHCL